MTELTGRALPDPGERARATDADAARHGRSPSAARPVGGASAGPDRAMGRTAGMSSGPAPAVPTDPSAPGRTR